MQVQVDLNARPGDARLRFVPAVSDETEFTSIGDADLVPIDEVARRLGLRASAIRYYEERGLVTPASKHAGRRWFSPTDIRRLAVIQYWQRTAMMSLDEIRDILAGPAATRRWSQIVEQRIDALERQAHDLNAAKQHLEHVLSHHRDSPPDGCDHFESQIYEPHS